MKLLPVYRLSASVSRTLLLGLCLVLSGRAQAEDAPRKAVAKTAPSYPELARKMHLAGKVKLQVDIAASGSVKAVKFIGGNPVFQTSATEAVKQWKFEKAETDATQVITLEFSE